MPNADRESTINPQESASDHIRAIQVAREEITSSMLALRQQVSLATNWREWARRRPGVMAILSFAIGFWLAAINERRRKMYYGQSGGAARSAFFRRCQRLLSRG